MSTQARALLIAIFGPVVALGGVLWVLVNVLIDTGRTLAEGRHRPTRLYAFRERKPVVF